MAPRTMTAAVRAAVNHARKAGRLQPWHEPEALLAARLAARLDDPETPRVELAKLASELRAALGSLPLADQVAGGDGAGGRGPGEDDPAGPDLAGLTRTGPTLGDSPDA